MINPLLTDIKSLQTQLNSKGANLKVDGIFGPLTQAAQTQFGSLITPPSTTGSVPSPYMGSGAVTVPNTVNSITSGSLGASPINTPTILPGTGAVGGISYIQSVTEANKLAAEKANQAILDQAKTDQTTGNNALKTIYERLTGVGKEKNDLYASTGVDTAKQAVDEFTSQLEAEQLSARRKVEEITNNNPGGMLASGQAVMIDKINRESLSKQADLAILQNNALRKYSTAKDIADRQIEAETEGLKIQLDAMKFFVSQNADTLSKAEQRQWDSIIKDSDREYQQQVADKKLLSDTKLELLKSASEQGAPISVQQAIQSAKTPEEALMKAGKYSGDILDRKYKEMQISNLQSQINERANSVNENGTINGKPQNASQSSANGYADRLALANVVIDQVGNKFTGIGSAVSNFLGKWSPNVLKSGDRQAFDQAKVNFVTAVLRRESGASIAPTEFANEERKYFPMPGDTQQVLDQKAAARNVAINNLYREANVNRPVLPGQIISSGGKRYKVESDGDTLTEIK